MKKILLTFGLVAMCLSTMAQTVFNYGFETPSSELTVGKLSYINFKPGDAVDSVNTDVKSGDKSLLLTNALVAGNNWERSLKFRNLGLESNTSYRVSFWVKGANDFTLPGGTKTTSNIRAQLMVGKDYADVPVVGSGNAAYDYTFTGMDSLNWKKYSAMFFYTHDSIQSKYYKVSKPDSTLVLDHYLSLNVYNPGKYFIDDINIEKSSIKGISFNGDIIKVDFGYTVDFAALRNGKDYSTAVLPLESAVVTLDGEVLEVEGVEVQPSGFYIFLASAFLTDSDQGKLKVSFTNPVGSPLTLKYNDAKAPYSWNSTYDKSVLNFTEETPDYDVNLTGSSVKYEAPFLKSSTPENLSFDLPFSTKTFKLVYSKKVNCSLVRAKLGNINLLLAQTGFSDTLTFTVPEATTLTSGSWSLSVTNIESEELTPANENTSLSFDFGISAAGAPDTVMNTKFDTVAENSVPPGWKFINSEGVREGGSGQSAGPRIFKFAAGGQIVGGMYLRTVAFNDTARFTYGTYADRRLHFKGGKHNVTFYAVKWKDVGQPFSFSIRDTSTIGNYIFRQAATIPNNVNGGKGIVTNATLNQMSFVIPQEGDYLVEYQILGGYGFAEFILGNTQIIGIPSNAALYKNKLSTSLSAAKSAIALMDSSIYDSPAKTALKNGYALYKDTAFTAPSKYDEVSAIVTTLTNNALTHKTNVDNFLAYKATANTRITANATTKFNTLDAYAKMVNAYNAWNTPVFSDVAQLKMYSDSLNFYSNVFNNTLNAVPILTYRITKNVTLAKSLKIAVPQSLLSEAEYAFVDDDAVATRLNSSLKQYIEGNLAVDSVVFKKDTLGLNLDSAANVDLKRRVKDSLDMTGFIRNPNFYTTQTVQGLNENSFPGWSTSGVLNGTGTRLTDTGVKVLASASSPVVDSYIEFGEPIGSGNHMPYLKQTLTNLPAGTYTVIMRGRRADPSSNVTGNGLVLSDIVMKSYGWVTVNGVDTLKASTRIAGFGTWNETINMAIPNVVVTDGTMTIGATAWNVPNYSPTMYFGDPSMFMTRRAPSYVYTGVKEVQTASTVKEVQYYNIQGSRINRAAKGLNIVRTIYSNGSTKVEKVMIK